MNKNEKLKNLLSLAIQTAPDDFAMQEVRSHIRAALNKLEHVEKKRERRDRQVDSNNWPVVNGQVINPFAVKQTIEAIEEMIADEKQKIDDISNRRKNKHDGEDDQELFG